MIFIDSNIPMYLVGADHSNKQTSKLVLERLIRTEERLVSDVEVIQEILHRYVAIRRRDAIQLAIDALMGLTDDLFSVDESIVMSAKEIVLAYPESSARDAIHYAVMKKHGIQRILTFDSGFDRFPDLVRIFQ